MLKALQVEAGFIACLAVGVLMAIALPCYVMAHACCSFLGQRRHTDDTRSSSWGGGDEDEGGASDCRRRALLFVLQLILILLGAGIVAMFVTNEQMSGALGRTPQALHTALSDATTFLRNTHRQLHFVITETMDRALGAAAQDLDGECEVDLKSCYRF
ncbi:unnamed protein product [Timema podura]|uniref:Uncharacterized protein n=1 Tax=Timema podura TaxID=61482 RepID=A0ABN7PCQ4_TIMPD|nr:unnamed protein product [Timema podura]